jgi:DNA-binding Xre family transcriptional regulator
MNFSVNEARLRAIMQERGIASFSQLSAATGNRVHWRTLYNLAAGSNWTRETLEAVCVALQCSPGDLIPELAAPAAKEHEHGQQ